MLIVVYFNAPRSFYEIFC